MAAPERVGSWRLGQEVNRRRFTLLELPTILCRSENQARGALRLGVIGNSPDSETMIVVGSRDLESNFGAGLHMNWRGRILVLLRDKFDDLRLLLLCHDRTG